MVAPRIHHLGMIAIINADPPVKNSSHDLQQENDHQLCVVESRPFEEGSFCNQPCEKNEIAGEQKIFQASAFMLCKIELIEETRGMLRRALITSSCRRDLSVFG